MVTEALKIILGCGLKLHKMLQNYVLLHAKYSENEKRERQNFIQICHNWGFSHIILFFFFIETYL